MIFTFIGIGVFQLLLAIVNTNKPREARDIVAGLGLWYAIIGLVLAAIKGLFL